MNFRALRVLDPALQAGLPLLAEDPAQLQAATALMDSTKRIARVVGPGLTGVLLALVPLSHFFSIDAVSFAISAGAVLLLWRPLAAPPAHVAAEPSARSAFAETWSALRARPALMQGLAGVALGNFTWGLCYLVGLPILVEQVLHGGAGAFGVLVAIFGAASLAGSAIAASVPVRRRRVWVFGGLGAMGLGYLLVAHGASHAQIALGLVVASLGGPLQNLAALRMVQDGMPRAHLGKGYAVYMVGSAAGAALGSAAAAALFPRIGVTQAMTAVSVAMLALSAAALARLAGRRAADVAVT